MGLNSIDYLDLKPSVNPGLGEREKCVRERVFRAAYIRGAHRVSRNSARAKTAVAQPRLAKSIGKCWGEQREEIQCGDPFSSAASKVNL